MKLTLGYVGFGFASARAASKNYTFLKSGQNKLKINLLISSVLFPDTLCIKNIEEIVEKEELRLNK